MKIHQFSRTIAASAFVFILVVATLAAGASLMTMTGAPIVTRPVLKSFQFRATNTGGTPVSDGLHTVVFSIWDDSTGGSSLWIETQSVQTNSGLGSAMIGKLVPIENDVLTLDSGDSTDARFLQVVVDGEVISPRSRLLASPYANIAGRMQGDISTTPGRVEIPSSDGSESDYGFSFENSNDSGAQLILSKPQNTGGNPSMDGVVILSSSLPGGQAMELTLIDGDTGISVVHEVGPDAAGDIQGSLTFYETTEDGSRARSSKPKEIVVVGSKITEKKSYYHDPIVQNNQSDYEFVTRYASGKRTYGPITYSSAVLPDTIPGYSMTVDSGGAELMMAKNNSDGSSCWIRTSQTHAGSVDSMVSANGNRVSKRIDKSTPLIAQALCRNESVDGRYASSEEIVGVDDGYSHDVDFNALTSGMHSTTEVDGRDYLIWQRGGSPSAGDSVSNLQFLSIDSGYSHSLKLSNGTSTTETVDASDYVVWRKSSGTYNTSGDTAKIATTLSADSGFGQQLYLTNGTTTMHSEVDGRDFLTWQRGYGMTTGNNDLQSSEHMSVDSGFIGEIIATNGTSTSSKVSKIESFTIKQSMKSSNSAGSGELLLETSTDNSSLRLSNTDSDRHLSQFVDDTSSRFEIYQNVIARSKVEKIVMQHTPLAGSRLYVGNLGFNSSDGLHVNADIATGTKVGINTNTPSAMLDVAGSVAIGSGTPIQKVFSGSSALDFPSTGAGAVSDLSLTVSGAATGDVVSLGVPSASVIGVSMYTAWVSSANVVTIRFANLGTSTLNPASGTFRAMITKF